MKMAQVPIVPHMNTIIKVLLAHNAIKMDVPIAQDGWPDASEKKAIAYSMEMHWIS
jgi:hypothetical protein